MEKEQTEPEDYKPLSDTGIIKFLTIAFVASMYLVIFLKIIFIK